MVKHSLTRAATKQISLPPAAATPVSYAPTAKPSKPLNLTPHKRG
jgi:hypothetical protein